MKTKNDLLEEVFSIPKETPDSWFEAQLIIREQKWQMLKEMEHIYHMKDGRDFMDWVENTNDGNYWHTGTWVWKNKEIEMVFKNMREAAMI